MSQYINVYMDNERDNYKNYGLYDIIVFIGQQSNKGHKDISVKAAYKLGKKVINSKLNKWHMTTIDRLVSAHTGKLPLNYDLKVAKPIWKIHKNKSRKVFSVIRKILHGYKNHKVLKIFEELCNKYAFESGSYVVGSPYYDVIKQGDLLVAQNYNNIEFKALISCAKSIEKFSIYR